MGGFTLDGGGGAGGRQISSIVQTRSFSGNLKLISLSLMGVDAPSNAFSPAAVSETITKNMIKRCYR